MRKNRFANIVPEHCFDFTLADFEQIINNDFIEWEAEWLNGINYFSSELNKFGIFLLKFFKSLYLKTKTSKFYREIT